MNVDTDLLIGVFDVDGLNTCDQVSSGAQNYLLQDKNSGKIGTTTDSNHLGDGIVPINAQSISAKGYSIRYSPSSTNDDDWILHIEETKQVKDIDRVLGDTFTWWKSSSSKQHAPVQSASFGLVPVTSTVSSTTEDYAQDEVGVVDGNKKSFSQFRHKSSVELWQAWLEVLRSPTDGARQGLLGMVLAERLQGRDEPLVYQALRAALDGDSLDLARKQALIDLLSDIATPTALSVLVEIAATPGEEAVLQRTALDGIERIGDQRWGERFHAELSSALEKAWRENAGEIRWSQSVALALAKVGAPTGVKALLDAIAGGDNVQARAASMAIGRLRNPAAIPVLAQGLAGRAIQDPVLLASGRGLAAMALPESAAALLSWARQAPDSAASLAAKWFRQLQRNPYVTVYLRDTLTGDKTFNSSAVQSEVLKAAWEE